MDSTEKHVTTVEALISATKDSGVKRIAITGRLNQTPSFRLSPGQSLRGTDENACIAFVPGSDGLQLSTDNRVHSLRLETAIEKRAIFNDTGVDHLGRIELRAVTTVGRVQILARDKVRGGHVDVIGLDIIGADARGESERPQGYGVYVLQGAFTLWNMQSDEDVTISADLAGLGAGRDGAPVRGSGIFVSGAGDKGGRLNVRRLETEAVYSDGGIALGTPDQITGGVFTVYGAHVDVVRNRGPVTTYGVNDMVLDNWGIVDRWTAEEKITSHGPSGIGFVNFGIVHELKVNKTIETFGKGARGFNVYTGTVNLAEFDRVVTHADGAVGIQVSQPVGRIVVHRGIETFGGTGDSLVKGVVLKLSAIALSIKPGGSVREIEIAGGVKTNGPGIAPIEQHGAIETMRVAGGFVAKGGGFDKI
ncbi:MULTISPECIES: hypothetical protein [unclassified Beijerinckia]|uniref:hypothetical protein n=1 Tax=unclassified Beijerinckia TaxID=2638183 RepID=UPI000898402C|nr:MULTISPECIES: hypothetical protein [unclassified Beijerinckia]MDH7799763.1 hypothetical protein [Beijerinckia sp. GAS462]SED36478.1 hypothetical protein SAMN05443249_5181 [Beijerinckia sp. 28-YEA-48]